MFLYAGLCVNCLRWLCVYVTASNRKCLYESSPKSLGTLKEEEMYREWRSTCFDWLRGQPRVCSTAAAWGIAALWFFCFGWWKDYLQSPTIAQRLDMHTHASLQIWFCFSHVHTHTHTHMHTCLWNQNSSMQRTGATTDMPFGLPADLAQRWETTSRTTSNSNIATHSATPKGTHSFPNETGSHIKMPHSANCIKKPAGEFRFRTQVGHQQF